MAQADKYSVAFSPEMSKFIRQDGGIETTTKIFITPNSPVEIRRVELKNLSSSVRKIFDMSGVSRIINIVEEEKNEGVI